MTWVHRPESWETTELTAYRGGFLTGHEACQWIVDTFKALFVIVPLSLLPVRCSPWAPRFRWCGFQLLVHDVAVNRATGLHDVAKETGQHQRLDKVEFLLVPTSQPQPSLRVVSRTQPALKC
ncbi:MAG: hypothetical protein KatS3mg114_0749 [Planctomycetaceae bacterium]|nr:MAG: hypothetical protein KatS3mg114_0749 [Planctomycetaceae bacterium]